MLKFNTNINFPLIVLLAMALFSASSLIKVASAYCSNSYCGNLYLPNANAFSGTGSGYYEFWETLPNQYQGIIPVAGGTIGGNNGNGGSNPSPWLNITFSSSGSPCSSGWAGGLNFCNFYLYINPLPSGTIPTPPATSGGAIDPHGDASTVCASSQSSVPDGAGYDWCGDNGKGPPCYIKWAEFSGGLQGTGAGSCGTASGLGAGSGSTSSGGGYCNQSYQTPALSGSSNWLFCGGYAISGQEHWLDYNYAYIPTAYGQGTTSGSGSVQISAAPPETTAGGSEFWSATYVGSDTTYIEFSPTGSSSCVNPTTLTAAMQTCSKNSASVLSPSLSAGDCLIATENSGFNSDGGPIDTSQMQNGATYGLCAYDAQTGDASNTNFVICDPTTCPTLPPGGSFTGGPSQVTLSAATNAICAVYNVVNSILFILALAIMLLGGTLYAGAQVLPGQTRGVVQGYAMGMILGGVVASIIAVVSPWVLSLVTNTSITQITSICPVIVPGH